jgi:hypothetical protein
MNATEAIKVLEEMRLELHRTTLETRIAQPREAAAFFGNLRDKDEALEAALKALRVAGAPR